MKKLSVVAVGLILLVGVGGWLFFTFGGSTPASLSASDQHVLAVQDSRLSIGNPNAPVKIIEYADVLCPYCAKANEDIIPQIQSMYVDRQKVHYEVRLVALISPDSERADEGAYCAAEQHRFWDYLNTAYKETWDNYYSRNKTPTDVDVFTQRNIAGFAARVGLDVSTWQQCMAQGAYAKTIADNQAYMRQINAYGTPHFIVNGQNYTGAPPFPAFQAVIDAALEQAKGGA